MKTLTAVLSLSAITLCSSLALAHGGGRGMMLMMDQNKDGKITLAEAETAMKTRFTQFDKNKDGTVTKEELPSDRPHFAFKFADANKDGKVTLAEATQKAKDRFAKLDANKDGSVTEDEIKAGRGHRGGKKGDCKDK